MLVQYSIQLLQAVQQKDWETAQLLYQKLSIFPAELAEQALKSDQDKIIFWCNVYNAIFQVKASSNKAQFEKKWRTFFQINQLQFFEKKMSFDFIEHRLLRKSKWKYGLGYVGLLKPSLFEQKFRVSKPDYRIHFILNCGATSCPIIRYLTQNKLDEQLARAEIEYLQQETVIDESQKRIQLNQLFLAYRADFGGRKGVIKMLLNGGIIEHKHSNYLFKFIPFNKKIKLNNFKS